MNDFTPSDGFFTCTVITLHEGKSKECEIEEHLVDFFLFLTTSIRLYIKANYFTKNRNRFSHQG